MVADSMFKMNYLRPDLTSHFEIRQSQTKWAEGARRAVVVFSGTWERESNRITVVSQYATIHI